MKVTINISTFLLILFFLVACGGSGSAPPTPTLPPPSGNGLILTSVAPPFDIQNSDVTFYQDISYGDYERNLFDIFLPNASSPTALVIFIHGGGFTGQDKTTAYEQEGIKQLIIDLLSQNIAFATINYRLLETNESEGVLKPLNDSKRALQFIKYHSTQLNLDKNRVLLSGSSAGAGTSLWIAFNDDMTLAETNDEILKESTRVQGVVALDTQSSYDVVEWPTSTFQEYQPQGLDFDAIVELLTEEVVLKFYGISNLSEINTQSILDDRIQLDILGLMTRDDPEFYLSNTINDYVFPTTSDQLLHHPLHSKALMDRGITTGVPSIVHLPSMGIDTRNEESIGAFILRKIGD